MSMLYFNPDEVRLKKYSASTASAAGRIANTIRIELQTADPYAVAALLTQLGEIEAAQRVSDAAVKRAEAEAKRATRQPSRSRSPRRLEAAPSPLLLPYHGDGQ